MSAIAEDVTRERPNFINWTICWVVIPLIPFVPLWIVGGPPRYPEILLIGGIGLAVRGSSLKTKIAVLTGLLLYSALTLTAGMFNLSLFSLMTAVQYMSEMRPSTSVEYAVVALLFGGALAASGFALRLDTRFESPKTLLSAFLIVTSVAAVDYWYSFSARGSYKRSAPGNAPFSSAVRQSGMIEVPVEKTNVLVVMVESMGLPQDPRLTQKFAQTWRRPELASRFDIKMGSSPFFGSTTNGEMRELCDRWADYEDVDNFRSTCLPEKFVKRGYRTTALHSFEGAMFDRADWYPKIGFQTAMFAPELINQGTGRCPGVFPGACDNKVPEIIGKTLVNGKNSQFIYWLTVNSHLPVPDVDDLPTQSCNDLDLPDEKPMICRLFSIWGDVSDSLAQMLLRPDLPPTDVLIVGDHMPPFFDRASRVKFDPTRVPWVLFKYKRQGIHMAAQNHPPHR